MPVIDVGADHGYLSLALASLRKRVYSIENKPGPFESLTKTLSLYAEENVTPILSDGLDTLPEDVREVYILGMGGKTIVKILLKAKSKLPQISHLVLEPQSDVSLVTEAMQKLNFINDDGCYVFEKKYYPILSYSPGKETLNSSELLFGKAPLKKKDPVLKEYLCKKLDTISHLSLQSEKKNDMMKPYQEALKIWN